MKKTVVIFLILCAILTSCQFLKNEKASSKPDLEIDFNSMYGMGESEVLKTMKDKGYEFQLMDEGATKTYYASLELYEMEFQEVVLIFGQKDGEWCFTQYSLHRTVEDRFTETDKERIPEIIKLYIEKMGTPRDMAISEWKDDEDFWKQVGISATFTWGHTNGYESKEITGIPFDISVVADETQELYYFQIGGMSEDYFEYDRFDE